MQLAKSWLLCAYFPCIAQEPGEGGRRREAQHLWKVEIDRTPVNKSQKWFAVSLLKVVVGEGFEPTIAPFLVLLMSTGSCI